MHGALSSLRTDELNTALRWLPPGGRVLDIGGGDGWQAKVLSEGGWDVTSIDIPGRRPPKVQHHPVTDYDGVHIPFPDGSFDVAFSSNVLEHVTDLPGLFAEINRVLRPGGAMVHVMPSATFRLWTSAAHFAWMAKFVLSKLGRTQREDDVVELATGRRAGEHLRARGLPWVLRKAVFPGPHGEFPSARAELREFSRRAWAGRFRQAGYGVTRVEPNRLFYTGYGILPGLGVEARRRLSRLLGSSCSVYVLAAPGTPAGPTTAAGAVEVDGVDESVGAAGAAQTADQAGPLGMAVPA